MTGGSVSYEELKPGRVFPSTTFEVTAQVVMAYRVATGSLPESKDIAAAPPMLAALYSSPRRALGDAALPPGCIHARQRFGFLRPVRIGDVLETTCAVHDRYTKRGRRYVAFETVTTGPSGRVTEGLITIVWAS